MHLAVAKKDRRCLALRWPRAAACCALVLTSSAHATPATAIELGTHVVKPGETLWSIAREHMHSPRRWRELQHDNSVMAPEQLRPGQVLQFGALATVVELSGNAWVRRSKTQQPVAKGLGLHADDVVITGPETFLSLSLPEGSRVVLPSSSAVRVLAAHGRLTRLQLLEGRIESHVQKQKGGRLEIRTRNSSMAVRGTHFRVRNEGGVATIEVIEGEVEAANKGERGPGQKISLGAGLGALLEGEDALRSHALLPMPERRLLDDPQEMAAIPVPGAVAYRMQIALDAQFLRIIHETQSNAPQAFLPRTLAPGTYHLRWTALDPHGIEGLPGTSVVHWPGPQPRAASVPEGTVQHLGNGRYEIRWPTQSDAQRVFELAREPSFVSPLISTPAPGGAELTIGPLELPGRYYWRVREAEGGDSSRTSAGGNFEAWEPRP